MLIASIFKEMRLLSRDLHGVAVLFIMPCLLYTSRPNHIFAQLMINGCFATNRRIHLG